MDGAVPVPVPVLVPVPVVSGCLACYGTAYVYSKVLRDMRPIVIKLCAQPVLK